MVFNYFNGYRCTLNFRKAMKEHKVNAHMYKNRFKCSMLNISKYLNKFGYRSSVFSFYNNKNTEKFSNKDNYFIIVISVIVIVIWIVSGLYIVKEGERGVVLRFGKYHHLVQPGLNWKPTFIDVVIPVNIESVRELAASGMMLTSDENVVRVEMNVQYRITNPKNYLFHVINADDSLQQATDSALRGVIGKYDMDRILTEGRTVIRTDTRRVLENTIYPYNMGITVLDVNFQTARPPEEVKAAFDDAIAARENEQQYIREAEAYANEVQPRANGQAQRILEEGRAYKARTVLEAQGEAQRFSKILPEYRAAPDITRKRLYISSMERVLSNTKKIFVNSKNVQNILLLPTGQTRPIKHDGNKIEYPSDINSGNLMDSNYDTYSGHKVINFNSSDDKDNIDTTVNKNYQSSFYNNAISEEKMLDHRQGNTQRLDIARKGRTS